MDISLGIVSSRTYSFVFSEIGRKIRNCSLIAMIECCSESKLLHLIEQIKY